MSPYDLDLEEQRILEAYEADEFVMSPDSKQEIAKAKATAKASLSKTRNVNIRLTERDLFKLRIKAQEEGLPYQTLMSSILHKAV